MKKRALVILTDCIDVAQNELRAVFLRENCDDLVLLEPTVEVANFNIVNAAFLLRLLAEAYPAGTIFLVVVNSERSRPERIIGRTKVNDFLFIGANTGVFGWLLKTFQCSEVFEVRDPGFFPFGGKYVHAPTLAKHLLGAKLDTLGTAFPLEKIKYLPEPQGEIFHIDNFGNIKFRYDISMFEKGELVDVSVRGLKFACTVSDRMMNRNDGEWVLYPGSSFGLPEIGQVRSKGFLGEVVVPGDIVTIQKRPS